MVVVTAVLRATMIRRISGRSMIDDPKRYAGFTIGPDLVGDVCLYYWTHQEQDHHDRLTSLASTVLKLDWTRKGLPEKVS
jgi:hypothetical protein